MKILISTPAYNGLVHTQMVQDLIREGNNLSKYNISWNWHVPISSIISFNRNLACDIIFRENYDWLLFWDADVSVKEDNFISTMVRSAYRLDAEIVGLPCRLKSEDAPLNCARKGKRYESLRKVDNIEKVDVVGTGVMLINKSVFQKMKPPYFSFIDTYHDGAGFFPEDWNFCEKSGAEIVVLPIKTEHIGFKSYES